MRRDRRVKRVGRIPPNAETFITTDERLASVKDIKVTVPRRKR